MLGAQSIVLLKLSHYLSDLIAGSEERPTL
jgi:hypothetical protein